MSTPVVVKNNTKKFLWILVMLILSVATAFITLCLWLFNRDTIYPHIYVETINVGEMAPKQAKEKVRNIMDKELEDFHMQLIYQDSIWDFSYQDLGMSYLYDEAIEEAYNIGRKGHIFERIKNIYQLKQYPAIIELKKNYQLDGLAEQIEIIKEKINKKPINAKIRGKDGNFTVDKEVMGIELEEGLLEEKILDALENFDNNRIEIPVKYIPANVTAEMLKQIKHVIGEYSTAFNGGQTGRAINIAIASESIDGILLMPGEEFSFNNQTGPRGVAEGYQEAPVIINGELVPGVGGGICQVSTTLYQALVRADLKITSRRNHGLPVAYVPIGQDATVAYGYIDLKFKNSTDHPIYLESYIKGNRIFTKIYGKKSQPMTITMESEIIETIEPEMEIKKTSDLYVGERKTEKEGKKGYRVNTYKVYSQGGKVVKREKISQDYYPPRKGLILEGTKPTTRPIEEKTEGKEDNKPVDQFPNKGIEEYKIDGDIV